MTGASSPLTDVRVVAKATPGGSSPRRSRWLGPLCLTVVGGASLAAAFEPFGLWPLGLIGPALLALAMEDRTPRAAALLGATFGLIFQGLLLLWLAQSMGVGAWVAVVLVQAAWFGALGAAVRLTAQLPGAPFWFATIWTAAETARSSWPFGGLPWGRVGFIAIDTPWQALLPYTGVAGAGFLLALAAALLGRGLTPLSVRRRRALLGAAAVLALGMLPLVRPWDPASEGSMRVAVVQGDVPGTGRRLVDHHREVTDNHVRATRRLAAQVAAGAQPLPQLVVWPENSTAVDPVTDSIARTAIQDAVDDVGAPILVGGMVDGPNPATVLNQGILWAKTGPTSTRYTKRHPVPFGEYIPLRRYLGGLSPRLAEVPRDMLAGTSSTPLVAAGTKIADAICFDVAYDEVLSEQIRNGARLVVVQTSNASFTGTSQLEQQFAMTRVRAVETGRAVAVASTNGVTALLDPSGTVLDRAPLRETAVLAADLPLSDKVSPAVRWGTGPGRLALVISISGIFWGALRLRRIASRRRGLRRPLADLRTVLERAGR